MNWLFESIERTLIEERDRPAIDSKARGAISYRNLDLWSRAIGSLLPAGGPVAILANRSAEACLAVLACYRHGVSFVPLNPGFPAARLGQIVEDSGAKICLFSPEHAELAQSFDCEAHAIALSASDVTSTSLVNPGAGIAYRMFTSGTTGRPKGVPIGRDSLSHYVATVIEILRIPRNKRASQFFDLSFDLAMHDIFVSLATGGTLVPASDMDLMMPHAYVARERIDLWFSVPMLAVAAAKAHVARPSDHRLSKVLFCGEALPWNYVHGMRALCEEGSEIWNLYGPTEATIAFSAYEARDDGPDKGIVPIGSPFGDNRFGMLVDGKVIGVSEGAEGELLLAGPQVFDGYDPEQSASPFIDEDGVQFYRTGDRVRCIDGQVEYIGRIDTQVKMRGHRIELSEIEAVCQQVNGVEAAVAMLLGEERDSRIGLAFQGDRDADFVAIRRHLPSYMVPSEFRHVEELPRNANGKLDRGRIGRIFT